MAVTGGASSIVISRVERRPLIGRPALFLRSKHDLFEKANTRLFNHALPGMYRIQITYGWRVCPPQARFPLSLPSGSGGRGTCARDLPQNRQTPSELRLRGSFRRLRGR